MTDEISDVSIINWNKTEAKPVASGLERTICSQALCGLKYLTVYQRTVQDGRQLDVQAGGDYHLVYVIEAKAGTIGFNGKSHAAEDGAGVLLAPGDSAQIEASGSKIELLHMVTPKAPAAVERDYPRTGIFLQSQYAPPAHRRQWRPRASLLRRVHRQASRWHRAHPTTPSRRARCAITMADRHPIIGMSAPPPIRTAPRTATSRSRAVAWSRWDDTQELEPGTLVFFPTGVPHRLRAKDGPLDYFEIQAWKSFKTDVLSEEKLGLKWYYDPVKPGAERVEWDQT